MQNVIATVEKDTLILRIDLKQDFGPSKSGKTHVVASSGGFVAVEAHTGISYSLNVNLKK